MIEAILPYIPEFYPRFLTVLVGMGEMLVILMGLGYGLLHLWCTPNSSSND